jgi:hypothetical protein
MEEKESMLNEVKDVVSEGLKRRFGDPIIGTFIVTYIIYHWKIFFYVFSSDSIDYRIGAISELIWKWDGIVIPFAVSIIILFFAPVLFEKPYKILEKHRVNRINRVLEADERLRPHLLTIQSLESKLESERSRLDSANALINEKDNTVSAQQQTIKILQNEADSLRNEVIRLQTHNEQKSARAPSEEAPSAHSLMNEMGIDSDLLTKNGREFRDHNKFDDSKVIKFYEDAITKLTKRIFDSLSNSNAVKEVERVFDSYVQNQRYIEATKAIERVKLVPTISPKEAILVNVVISLIGKLASFTK